MRAVFFDPFRIGGLAARRVVDGLELGRSSHYSGVWRFLLPREDLETFHAFELTGVGSDERGIETAGLGGDEEIEEYERIIDAELAKLNLPGM